MGVTRGWASTFEGDVLVLPDRCIFKEMSLSKDSISIRIPLTRVGLLENLPRQGCVFWEIALKLKLFHSQFY